MRLQSVVTSVREIVLGGRWVHDDSAAGVAGAATPFDLTGPWYYDLRRSLVRDDYSPFDADGVPVRGTGAEFGQRPILALSFGLAHLTKWILEGDEASRAAAQRIGRWANSEIEDSPLFGAVAVRVSIPGLAAPWPNALAQGLALSLLARLNAHEPDPALSSGIASAVRPFGRTISEGGFRDISHDSIWFEEYPFPGGGRHVLNGFIYSLWGLRDAGLSGNAEAQQHYTEGVESLTRLLPRYRTSRWSRYDLPDNESPRLASFYYQRTHAGLLRAFAGVEPDHAQLFSSVANTFDQNADTFGDRMFTLMHKRKDRSLPVPLAEKSPPLSPSGTNR